MSQPSCFCSSSFESLEFFDEVEVELRGYPWGKFKGDIFACVGSAIIPRELTR